MSAFQEISVAEAQRRAGELVAVDVRAEHEYQGPLGHIAGARLVPLPELEARARELPRDRPLLLVCRSGGRSAKACEQLAAAGLGPLFNLTGGMIAWNRAGLPIEPMRPATRAALVESLIAFTAQVGARPPAAVRASLEETLRGAGTSLADPTREGVERCLQAVAASFAAGPAPADLELALAAFRRALAAL